MLGLALGAKTFKLPFGHRGGNHPVKRSGSRRVEITCQNHGFAVDPASVEATPARLTHVNLNDDTVEGLEVPGVCYSVQYHPEAGPGPPRLPLPVRALPQADDRVRADRGARSNDID